MASSVSLASSCSNSNFTPPSLLGAEIYSVTAELVENYENFIPPGYLFSQPSKYVRNATFCNVTVSYTHPGYGDTVNVETWLPVEGYNGKLQAVGGGGWSPGRGVISYWNMAAAVDDGYVTVSTDAGLAGAPGPDPWGNISPGNLDLGLIQNFGHAALHDEAVIAKSLTKDLYGKGPEYSYWNGCSQGGREGMALAQHYPTDYDGIMAAAPAMSWSSFVMSTVWPAFYMNSTGQYPRGCELDYITAMAISVCDELDGVADGLIAEPEQCLKVFNPSKYIDETFICPALGAEVKVSAAAANVAAAIWQGPTTANGKFMWYGFDIGANLSTIASTTCSNDGECNASIGQASIALWWRVFIDKDPNSNRASITREQFDDMYRGLKLAFGTFETNEKDLSAFRNAGGKLINFHGLADEAIPSWNSLSYFKQVSEYLDGADDFYRYYRAPGLAHCAGGAGGQPDQLFSQLRAWVENGTAPGYTPVSIVTGINTTRTEILCPYPSKAVFDNTCTEVSSVECWSCSSSGNSTY